MLKLRRFAAVLAFLGTAAALSSSLWGQVAAKRVATGTTAQSKPAFDLDAPLSAAESRFEMPGVITYQPVRGDIYFALKLQPKLEPTPRRPRDIIIMLSTAATQAGPSWLAAQQIAQGVVDAAGDSDRIALWTLNEPQFTKNVSLDFYHPRDYAEGKRLAEAFKQLREKEYPAGDTDLPHALTEAIKAFDADKDRKRILLFLGDGLSTHNPMSAGDRVLPGPARRSARCVDAAHAGDRHRRRRGSHRE
jgi:hypothetical protein